MRRWAIINTLLGVIVALLTLEIVRTWARELPTFELTPHAAAPEEAAPKREKGKRGQGDKAGGRADQTPAALVAVIAEKELFDPSRRPPTVEEVKVEAVKETGPPPGVTIVGVRIFGKDREVFLTDQSQGNVQRRLRIGDQVVGYTIKAIEPTGVTLSSPSGDPVTMALVVEKGKAPATVTPRAGGRGNTGGRGTVTPSNPGTQTPGVQTPQQAVIPSPQQLPAEVRQKLENLKQSDRGVRSGRKR
jgi:hypothetical protein